MWATTVTSTAVIEGTSLAIKIEMNLSDSGWFWMDNIVLKKIVNDDTEKENKRAELKRLIDECKAFKSVMALSIS